MGFGVNLSELSVVALEGNGGEGDGREGEEGEGEEPDGK